MNHSDTICAVSSAPGVGGVALIRISGPESLSIVKAIFVSPKAEFDLLHQKGYTIHFGKIVDGVQVVDEVLLSLFQAPNSYTGEDVVEITCHGSIYIQQLIVQVLIAQGARIAQPGEFTQRAFLNGKLDLSQAEAVADLIASSSAGTHRLAINQMRGGFSKKLAELRAQMLNFVSLIELELDFSEEEVEFVSREELYKTAQSICNHIARLADSFQLGNAIKNGIPVAIVGETNAGKSTLLNLLLNDDKAIVSDIHGTTRDSIEDTVNINGFLFRFIDTAGLRETTDEIESIGIERAYQKMTQADLLIWLVDVASPSDRIDSLRLSLQERVGSTPIIMVFNKIDRIDTTERSRLTQTYPQALFISAKERIGETELIDALLENSQLKSSDDQDVIVSNIRHYEALTQAKIAIERAIDGLQSQIPIDLTTQDIREAMLHLGEITGNISSQDVLTNIFSRFCIGK